MLATRDATNPRSPPPWLCPSRRLLVPITSGMLATANQVGRLVEICKSLPFPRAINGLGWPHGYDGLLVMDEPGSFPWQETLNWPRDSRQVIVDAAVNPFDIPDIDAILLDCTIPPPARGKVKPARDCFSRLPWELREAIAALLITADALSLRQGSASFLPLLSSNTFRASRFASGGERSFVFEKPRSREPTNWLTLYRLTCQRVCPPGLRNRCRIWGIIRPLVEIIRLKHEPYLVQPLEESMVPFQLQVTGDLNSRDAEINWLPFDKGCHALKTTLVPVRECLWRFRRQSWNHDLHYRSSLDYERRL
ncbi:hypothetical protein K431DRAFT_344572 [Polychaeton citri CBS 116435]|uniref:Uncharacterized protein n=1 Tax=Polychaeton citri CBS 116435 TaxID=1314669 RepID=A0A9P4QCI8_9PEZI|nr:hypothetical protein K431DRAFT_344572 [Polychaeton citri CBS 116435]